MDQVREQRDAVGQQEDRRLSERGGAEDGEREADRDQALTRALDGRVDQAVAVAIVLVRMAVVPGREVMGIGVLVSISVIPRPQPCPAGVNMRTGVCVSVDTQAVAMHIPNDAVKAAAVHGAKR